MRFLFIYVAVAIGALFLFIREQTLNKPTASEGKSLLRFHPVFGWLGIAGMAVALFLAVYVFASAKFTLVRLAVVGSLCLFIFGAGAVLFIWSKNHQVLYDDSEVTVTGIRKKKVKFLWQEVKTFRLNNLAGHYVVTLFSGKEVIINPYLMGFNDFLSRMKKTVETHRPL